MTTTFVADNRTELEQCDSASAWTGTISINTNSAVEIESTDCLTQVVSNTAEDAYTTITSDDYSGGGSLGIWIRTTGTMDTLSAGGVAIQVGDGTNRIAYHLGGIDATGFRHDTGPHEWAYFLLDLANKPANFTALAGSEGSLNEAAITQVGVSFVTTAKALANAENCFWDIVRFADNGDDVVFVGGTTSGAAGNGGEIAVIDRSTGNQQAYGVLRELASNVYGIQGNVTLGDSTSSSDQFWEETNATYAWEDRGLSSNNYYRFALIGSSTATNCEFLFTSTTFSVPDAASASFDGNGADITVCTMDSCNFLGIDQGVETSDDTGDSWENCVYAGCGTIVANGCDLSGGAVSGYEGTSDTSALSYDLAVDPDGELDNMSFTKGTASTHAIEFGTNIPSEITLRGIDFSGYNASDDQTDSTLDFKDTGGTITVNLIGCTGDISETNSGCTVVFVINPVQLSITTRDLSDDSLVDTRVLVETADTSGPLPYEKTSSITRSGSTATVTCTAHGVADGKKAIIRGALEPEYNGVQTTTWISADSYSYTVSGTPDTPANDTRLLNAQDETSYNNSPTTEGTFSGGTGHAISDVLTLSNGATITVDNVSTGEVTEFTVNSGGSRSGLTTSDTLTQGSTTGSGIDFTLSPDTDNLGISTSGVIIDADTTAGVATDTRSYSGDQPIKGNARKMTASPYYKTGSISGTIDASSGLTLTVKLASDE